MIHFISTWQLGTGHSRPVRPNNGLQAAWSSAKSLRRFLFGQEVNYNLVSSIQFSRPSDPGPARRSRGGLSTKVRRRSLPSRSAQVPMLFGNLCNYEAGAGAGLNHQPLGDNIVTIQEGRHIYETVCISTTNSSYNCWM